MQRCIVPFLVLAAVVLTLAARPALHGQVPRADVQGQGEHLPLLSLSGAQTKIEGRSYHRLLEAGEFQGLFMRHLGHRPEEFDEYYNPHGVPLVNFQRCMVVAIFQGDSWNSAGVYVHSVEEDDERIVIRFDDISYQTSGGFTSGDELVVRVPGGDGGGGRRVRAYGIFILPHSQKALVLEENVQNILGQPPQWRERARFEPLSE